jgi:class 3 adenylate cyclase
VTGETPVERRAAALALLLETAKELSQQGEPARLLDKAARLLLQAMRVDRVDILTLGEEDEMVPRVSKVRPGSSTGSGRVPRLAARKAGIERVAVLIAEKAPATDTDSIARISPIPASGAPQRAAAEPAEPALGGQSAPAASTDAVQVASGAIAAAHPASGAAGASPATGTGTGTAATVAEAVAGAAVIAATPGGAPTAGLLGTAVCAPLLGMQATAVGLLYVVAGEEAVLEREDLEFVTAFAGVVAVTLENLSLMERARDEAVAQAGYQRHFAPYVADQIAGQNGGLRLDGDRRKVAFLRCEIRGFAELAEEMHPEAIARQLNDFFSEVLDVVFEHGGTLVQVTGTGLTALWGAPLGRKDDADEAVQAAIGMQRGLERLNGEWSRQQRPHLDIAIGIDLGQVFAGSVGSDRRLEYTAIGKPVSRASALCAAAGAGEVLVTEAVLEALSTPPPIDPVAAPEPAPGTAPAPAAPAPPSPAAAGGAEPAPAVLAYRVDWRTPPTLRQSGEVPQEP